MGSITKINDVLCVNVSKVDDTLKSGIRLFNDNSFCPTKGGIDTSFVIGTGFNTLPNTISTQTDGKIIVVGDFSSYSGVSRNRIIRLNTDGSVDNSFVIGNGFNANVLSSVIQTDGKIIVGGTFTSYSGVSANRIIRLNTDGSVDSSFAIGTGFSGSSDGTNSMVLQPDGKIIVAGQFSFYNGLSVRNIVRLNTDGSVDSGFVIGTGFNNPPRNIKLQSDGKVLAVGGFSSYSGVSSNRIIRLNTNGSVDSSFTIGTGFSAFVYDLSVQTDGKIIVGGTFTSYSGVSRNGIIRLNTNGSVDSGFVIGTGFTSTDVRSVVSQTNGKILVGGSFTSYSGVSANRIIGLNSDGSVDSGFVIGTGFNNLVGVSGIALTYNNTITILGGFTTYQTLTYNRIIRLIS